jgi:hypothetical protein
LTGQLIEHRASSGSRSETIGFIARRVARAAEKNVGGETGPASFARQSSAVKEIAAPRGSKR